MRRSIWQRWLSRFRFLGIPQAHAPLRRFRRLLLESLENRLTPATFTPTVFNDLPISSLAAVDSLGQITDQGNAITLRSAIIAANANGDSSTDTIQLLAGTYTLSLSGGIGGSGTGEGFTGDARIGDLDITSGNLIIAGAGMNATTIQQTTPTLGTPSNDRVFEINPGAAVGAFEVGFQDLAITGGTTPDGGGAIASRAAANVLNIARVAFDSNTALAGGGGALLVDGGGELNIADSVFSGNTSNIVGGGAIAMDGGTSEANLQIFGTSFVGNHGDQDGGAIELTGSFSSTSSITSSNFENNQALGTGATGGAIDIASTGAGVFPIQRNRFANNSAALGADLHNASAVDVTVNADDNWWGASTGPANGAVSNETGSTLTLDTWLQLRFSADPTSLLFGGASTLTADLLGRNIGGPLAVGSLAGLPSVPATFENATLGTLSGATPLVGGVATATYTSTSDGTGGADVTVDGETLSVSFDIAPAPHVPDVTGASTTVATQTSSGLVITVNSADGAEVTHFRISNIVNGTLFQNDGTTAIQNGDFITVAEGLAGLKFTPTAGLGSLASTFSFDVQAAQGTSGAGLSPAATASITVNDVTAPGTTIDVKPNSYTNSTSATFNFSATDDVSPAVATFEGSLDGADYAPVIGPVTFDNLSQGQHTFLVRATDASNNTDPTAASWTWVVDTTAPTVIISDPSATSTTGAAITYTVTYADNFFGSSTLTSAKVTLNKTGTANGDLQVTGSGTSYTVTIQNITGAGTLGISILQGTATDLAGNLAPAAGPSATFDVTGSRTLGITANGLPPVIYVGDTINLTVNYANTGTQAATGVVLRVTLPANSTFYSAGSTTGWTSLGSGVFSFNVGTVAAGATGSAIFAAIVNSSAPVGSTLTFATSIRDSLSPSADLATSSAQSASLTAEPNTTTGGVLVQFSNNIVSLSPDLTHLAGSGDSQQVYYGASGAANLLPLNEGGVLAQFASGNKVFFSPDGTHLDGGGASVQVYDGSLGAVQLSKLYNGGVLVQVLSSNVVFYSPDARNLVGGGSTTQVYDGSAGAVQLVPLYSGGVLVRFLTSNAVTLSPDYKNLASGGQTTQVYDGTLGAVELTRVYGGGVYTRLLASNVVFYSPDFKNLASAAGQTVRAYDGGVGALSLVSLQGGKGVLAINVTTNVVTYSTDFTHLVDGPAITAYNGASGEVKIMAVRGGGVLTTIVASNVVFYSADGKNLTTATGQTTQVYDGSAGAVSITGLNSGGVMTRVNSSNAVFFSPDFKNLLGGSLTRNVYDGKSGAISLVSLVKVQAPIGQSTVTQASGLKIITLNAGSGAAVSANGNSLNVHYTGWLENGFKFDSSRDRSSPFTFTLGTGSVIAGWDQGLVGMKVGEVRKLVIPAALAYGANGKGNIPPNAVLTFEVELLAIN